MDRNSIIILVLCFLLLMLWPQMVKKLYPPKPLPPGVTNVTPRTATSGPTSAPPAAVTPPPVLTAVTKPAPAFVLAGEEDTVVVANQDARYTFTSHGGGLKRVELLHYKETITRQNKRQTQTNNVAELNAHVSVPVLAILGDEALLGDGVFALQRTATGVRAEKTLTNGLRLVKEFDVSTNYLVRAQVRFENVASAALAVPAQEWVIGTCVGLAARQPRFEYRAGTSNVVWATVQNQFFALAAMPREPALQVVSRPVGLPRDSDENPAQRRNATPPRGYQTALVYPPMTLTAGESVEREVYFFAGPKEYRTLARLATRFENNVDLVMGFGTFFGFFSKGLLLSMNWLHHVLSLSYGWAIIVITIIIKALFWPLTQASTRSMKRMAALQPQMKALQEKYKEDPVKMNKKMMEFWKEHKVSPLGGCLPMLLQMPVFIGFFYMIQSAIELRGEGFLWVVDLSQPDTLFYIPGFGFPFNLLPLLMGATMLWQSHMTPPSPGMDPMQQKMMRYLPLMFLFMLYNFSAGLTLYWTVQNLLSILQMKLTKTIQPAGATAPAAVPTLPPKKRI